MNRGKFLTQRDKMELSRVVVDCASRMHVEIGPGAGVRLQSGVGETSFGSGIQGQPPADHSD